MKKPTVYGIVTIFVSMCATIWGLEVALRIYHGKVLHFESLTVESPKRMAYHPRLGWIPRPGRFVGGGWTSNVNESGLRSNGMKISARNGPILAIGDSFTFGDEVEDSETWPAQLERILNQRVLNAGVGAYGIDQATLRAELLLDEYHPDVVILSFISDDINRTEFSYYPWGRGPKPYFQLENGSLVLRNVPVPELANEATRRFRTLRHALGYSFFANAVVSRIAPRWWQNLPRPIKWIHDYGEDVSAELMTRLDGLTRNRGGKFIAIAFATNGHIGNNARLPNVIKKARKNGIQVLDLASETLKFQPDELQHMFRPGGHYSPAMNGWVADRIATFLHERSIAK